MSMEEICKGNWSEQEDDLLLSLIDDEVRRKDLPPYFPNRTIHAVTSRFDMFMRRRNRSPSIEWRSRELADAINQLIDRMPANDVAEMLGKPHLKIPGTERVYYGQGAERALAA